MVTKIKLWAIAILFVFALALLLSNNAAPDFGPVFGLKRLQENIFLNTKVSPAQKADYKSKILDNRLSELKYLVENQKIEHFLNSSLRYAATAGELTDIIKQNNLSYKISGIQAKFNEQQKVLEGLMVLCQKNDNTECKYIQDDANYLKLYIEKLSSKL